MALPHAARLACATACRGAGPRSTTASCAAQLWAQCDARFETAKVEGRAPDRRDRRAHRPRRPARAPLIVDALGWRRVLGRPRASSRPRRRSRRGLEVHPHGAGGADLDVWVERGLVRRGYAWRVPAGGEERIGVGLLRPARPRQGADRGARRAAGAPTPCATRATGSRTACAPAAEDGVFFVGDSAGHCFPLSGEGIRTAFYFGIAAGREMRGVLAGERTGDGAAPLRRVLARATRRAFRLALRLQRLIPALPPLTAVLRLLGRRALRERRSPGTCAGRPGVRLVPGPGAPVVRRRGAAKPPVRDASAAMGVDAAAIAFDERGLVPCVIQDWRTARC